MKALTARQRQLLDLVAAHLEDGVPPSAAGLAEQLGLAGESSVSPVLRVLAGKGYLQISGGVRGRQRVLRLTDKARLLLRRPGLPLLGSIPAGPLGEAIEQAGEFIERLDDLLPWRSGDFLLTVRGDSMVGAGVLSGDRVLIRPGVQVAAGEVAAVRVGPEAEVTLKRVLPDPAAGTVTLRAANPAYPDRVLPVAEVEVIGVVRGLVRADGR